MKIVYSKDCARVSESMVPVGVAGLLLGGIGMLLALRDLVFHGFFWGWGGTALIGVT